MAKMQRVCLLFAFDPFCLLVTTTTIHTTLHKQTSLHFFLSFASFALSLMPVYVKRFACITRFVLRLLVEFAFSVKVRAQP